MVRSIRRPSARRPLALCPPTILAVLSVLALTGLSLAGAAQAEELRVLKIGLGEGTVESNRNGLICGFNCDATYGVGDQVTLSAQPAAGSSFAGWRGNCVPGINQTCVATFDQPGDLAVVAEFRLLNPPAPLGVTDLDPGPLDGRLNTAPNDLGSPARFLAALPPEYLENWILMTRSESLQTGTAAFPRILLPNNDATRVFSIGLAPHDSYPGSHPNAIEYMQWDQGDLNFRFHEVILAPIPAMGTVPARNQPGVAIDDFKCASCHSTGNILNDTALPGTTGVVAGVVPARSKPNWDTYDSWGGMLPFNRDRIYAGTLEEVAFRRIFNLWSWRGSAQNDQIRQILEQLVLQSSNVAGGQQIFRTVEDPTDAGHLALTFSPSNLFNDTIDYDFGSGDPPLMGVNRGGNVLTLQPFVSQGDEGRGVQLFDLLGGLDGTLNAQRVAGELMDHRFATGSVPIDVRPLALAIASGCIVYDDGSGIAVSAAAGTPLNVDSAFFNARNGMTLAGVVADTRARAQGFPARKALIQRLNLDRGGDIYLNPLAPAGGLIQEYDPNLDTSVDRIRREVFRRPLEAFSGAVSVGDGTEYVDREDYTRNGNYNTEIVSLFRYFLEPLGVAVDSWSMSVRGRKRTYTFGDVFGQYTGTIGTLLTGDLKADPRGLALSDPPTCAQLIGAVNSEVSAMAGVLPARQAPPTYTDVQRIFNRSCIECHGGLDYPPYSTHPGTLDLSEIKSPAGNETRFSRAYTQADANANLILQRVIDPSEDCPGGVMPCGGPPLSKVDVETLRRWVAGGTPRTVGDPHIRTVDGVSYDFQAAGEFVLLRGENLEIQARHVPVETAEPLGPDAYTGLTSCVSVTGALAMRFGDRRITYQPSLYGPPDPEQLELRVDGELVGLPQSPRDFGDVLVTPTSATGGLRFDTLGGTSLVVTPRYWHHHQVWILNLTLERVRATEGLMGAITPDSWLPRLAQWGERVGPRPGPLTLRYKHLYDIFGESWRVTSQTSLFDYAPGTSTKDFTVPHWPNGESPSECKVPLRPDDLEPPPALEPIPLTIAEAICSGLVDSIYALHCAQDVAATGEVDFAEHYKLTEALEMNKAPGRPKLLWPPDFTEGVGSAVELTWEAAMDPEGGEVHYSVCLWRADTQASFAACRPFEGSASQAMTDGFGKLTKSMAYFWKVVAEDSEGERSESETWRFETK